MSRRHGELSPLEAYERAERQKSAVRRAFRARLTRLHSRLMSEDIAVVPVPGHLSAALRGTWRDAARAFIARPAGDWEAYGEIVMTYGLRRIDPKSERFARDLRDFYRNYLPNFPLSDEQTTREQFRNLWTCTTQPGGYQEVGYSAWCPLTGRYIMGLNFTIQPQSNSVHFIYGFVNPIARRLGGLSQRIIDFMRDTAGQAIAAHIARHKEDRPDYYVAGRPLILFEKNVIAEMSLTKILLDAAKIDIDRPPRRGTRLVASAISPNLRDRVWHLCGGSIVDYNYIQSSIGHVVRVPDDARESVIACLNRKTLDRQQMDQAERILRTCLGGREPGCRTLNLCAFAEAGATTVLAAQIRRSNEIFHGNSVVMCPPRLAEDIYWQAQMASLTAQSVDGVVALRSIAPAGGDFDVAEQSLKRLLAGLSWEELRQGRDRTYAQWLS